jgi:hypothetical protein
MPERRKTMRAPCRLRCRVAKGSQQIPARIVDVSKEGLCLISPDWLKPKENYEISIDVPGTGVSRVHIEIWHIRREKSQGTNGKVWIAGAMLTDADEAYAKLLKATGIKSGDIGPEAEAAPTTPNRASKENAIHPIDSIEPKVFRIRCKARGGPRSRVLSLAADSEEQARALATRDLGDEWAVLEVREA